MSKVITFGELMLRLSPPDNLRFSQTSSFDVYYGGGEANVAVSLAHYGVPVEFVSRLPKNDLAHCAVAEMRKRGVETNHIIFGGERLGIYFLEKGAINRGSNIIYDRAHSAIAEIRRGMIDWDDVFSGAQWFHWSGITPAISESAAEVCRQAIEAANHLGITVSTDLNYRSKLWNYGQSPRQIMPSLVEGCDLIHAGQYASEKFFGMTPDVATEGDTIESHRSLFEKLSERFPKAKIISGTLRQTLSASHNNLSGLLYNGDQLLTGPTYNITPIVDRVGGGDAFMGGLIYGLLSYQEHQQALEFAIAASSLKHTIPGDANLSTVAEVEQLMKGDGSGRVSR